MNVIDRFDRWDRRMHRHWWYWLLELAVFLPLGLALGWLLGSTLGWL